MVAPIIIVSFSYTHCCMLLTHVNGS
jgi:hypothetical protein